MEIKVLNENVDDLYNFCAPTIESLKESTSFFSKNTQEGWLGMVVYDEGMVKAMACLQPLETSMVNLEGEDLYFLPCFWVKPGEEKKGYGKALMDKVLELSGSKKGVVTETEEEWMPASFFKKFGFEKVIEKDPIKILLKKFDPKACISMIPTGFQPLIVPNKIIIEVVYNPLCPYILNNYEVAINKSLEFAPYVHVLKHYITCREDTLKFGESNFYVDGDTPFRGPVNLEKLVIMIKDKIEVITKTGGGI